MSFSSFVHGRKPRRNVRRAIHGTTGRRLRFETFEDRRMLSFTPVGPFDPGDWPAVFRLLVPSQETPDLNNDGYGDGVLVNTWDDTVSVVLSDGQGGYGEAREYGVGEYPVSVVVGDFNEDGNLDLTVANQLSGNLSVLLNNGDGMFENITTLPTFGNPRSIAVGDFNADGKLDLGVAAYGYGLFYYGYATVHAGDGMGNFAAPKTNWTLGANFNSATAVDLDGDGADDLVIGNEWNAPTVGAVHIFRGDASGFLQPSDVLFIDHDLPPFTVEVKNVQLGDLNGDGALDIVTANGFETQDVSVFLSDGEGGYGAAQSYLAGSVYYYYVGLADYNRDGWLDIVADNSVLLNNGDWGQANPNPLPGDYNANGTVDAADYVVWRKNSGTVDEYDVWRAHFGQTLLPTISLSGADVTEGNSGTTDAIFTVTLSKASDVDVTMRYDTADTNAKAGSDYTATSGTVTIPAGQTSGTFTVAVLGDHLAEPTEFVYVELSAPTNATIQKQWALATILDDEPRISINDVTDSEGRNNQTTLFVFTVTLSAAYDQPVTMSYQTVDVTATTIDNDYVAQSGTLTFDPGETTKTITIEVNADNKVETDEVLYVHLFDSSINSVFTKSFGIGTILNDD